jgi:elongation factor 1-alpha
MTQITCEFGELLEKIDRKSGKTIEKTPEFLKSGDSALVKIIPLKPICVEKYVDYPSLGRFVLYDREWIIAVGTIKHVEKKNLSINNISE